MSSEDRFKGKTVVVTGAGGEGATPRNRRAPQAGPARRGTGQVLALEFARMGARVVAVDLIGESAQRTVDLIAKESGDAIAVEANVASTAEVDQIFERAEAAFGRVDIVVNNAGLGSLAAVVDTDDALWQSILDVNLTGPFLISRRALPGMIDAGYGVIVNLISIAGIVGGRTGAAYTASKHGLVGLTQNIAVAYGGQGIRCVGVCPGLIRNEPVCAGPEIAAATENRLSKGHATNFRAGTPEEVTAVVTFLASEAASFINGAIIPVDGGWTAA